MIEIICVVLAIAALAALGGTLLFVVKPLRERAQKQLAEIEAEREKLKTQTETRQKELLLEAREEARIAEVTDQPLDAALREYLTLREAAN